MSDVVIVRGTCGAGKSKWIGEECQLLDKHGQSYLVIDMADMLDLDWDERVEVAAHMAVQFKDQVFIEGIFGPNTPSFKLLFRRLKEGGANSISHVVIHRALSSCQKGIKKDGNNSMRMELAEAYWHKFDLVIKAGNAKNKRVDLLWQKEDK